MALMYIYTTQNKFNITKQLPHFLVSFSHRLPNLIFKYDNAVEGSIQYLTQQNLIGNIMWNSVKLHFSVKYKKFGIFLKSTIFFIGVKIQFYFKIATLEFLKN